MAIQNNPTGNQIVKAIKDLEKPATASTVGLVKPDGTTITITQDGTLSSVATGKVIIEESAGWRNI